VSTSCWWSVFGGAAAGGMTAGVVNSVVENAAFSGTAFFRAQQSLQWQLSQQWCSALSYRGG